MIPLHYPDSCIFFEMFEIGNKITKQYARAYFYDTNDKLQAIISTLTFGEITKGLLELEERKRSLSLENINDHAFKKMINITSPQFEDYKLALELKEIDYKLEPADALHLAMAINNKAQIFMTMGERDLANNPNLTEFLREKGLKINILGELTAIPNGKWSLMNG